MKIYDSKGREIKSPAKKPHPHAGVMREYEEILFGCASDWSHVELPRGQWATPETHELVFVEYVDPDGCASQYWAAWPIGEAQKAATPPAQPAESIAQKWAKEREEADKVAAIRAAEKAQREELEAARQETLSTIRELFPKLVYSNRRGDLGGWYPEKVWSAFPDHIACFIGGVSANVVTDSESGLSWDLGDSYSGKWTLHPSMIADSVDGQKAITAKLRERAARAARRKTGDIQTCRKIG